MKFAFPSAPKLGISLRQSRDDDLPFLSDVYASTRAEELAPTGWPEDVQRRFLATQFEAQHAHYRRHYPEAEWLVIEVAGESAGRLYVEEWPDQIRLIDIALLPAFRGRGIGSALLADLVSAADARPKPLTIHVEKFNRARGLYARLGFVPIGEAGAYDLLERRPQAPPLADSFRAQ
jgi:ribosomal protein S18 acetylase RimI-like enzyme